MKVIAEGFSTRKSDFCYLRKLNVGIMEKQAGLTCLFFYFFWEKGIWSIGLVAARGHR